MEKCMATSKTLTITGDITLHYHDAGSGRPIVLVPGWSQAAVEFVYQINDLRQDYRVIALDMRGHGQSSKPSGGYRVSRLAHDLHEVLVSLNLQNVILLGHSMGCSVIWSYWELFGPERIDKMVWVDQVAAVTENPAWSEKERVESGAIFTPTSLYETANALVGTNSQAATEMLVGSMLTGQVSAEDKTWIIAQNLEMPREYARNLLINHCMQDWRDVVREIRIPALVIGGEASIFPFRSVEWIANQIPGSRFELFSKAERGSHFMFFENPTRFNQIVRAFAG